MPESLQPADAEPAANRVLELSASLEALASPTRIQILHRLSSPAYAADLARQFRMTRQAVRKHLAALAEVGLVRSRPGRRGALPATLYGVSPIGLFALKERVRALAIRADPLDEPPPPTVHDARRGGPRLQPGPGLLMVHGDVPGRWLPLRGEAWVLGREPKAEVPLPYDPYASARHALLVREEERWAVTDLDSSNGTFVDFRRLPPGVATPIRVGSILTVGHSQLLLKTGEP